MHMGGHWKPHVVVTEMDCPDPASKALLVLLSCQE